VALTKLGYINPPYEIASGSIILYAPWLNESEDEKVKTIIHEIGHVFLTPATINTYSQGHTNDGSIMDANLGSRMIHSYQQLVIKIIYNKNPGDNI
jgi:predicted metallopeptidase